LHDDGDTESEEILTETPLDEHRIPPAPRRTSGLTSCRSVSSECHTAAIANTGWRRQSAGKWRRVARRCRWGASASTAPLGLAKGKWRARRGYACSAGEELACSKRRDGSKRKSRSSSTRLLLGTVGVAQRVAACGDGEQEATIGRVVVCVDQVVGACSAALVAAWGLLRLRRRLSGACGA
jgi:hypothetical protein